jgi:hypothetical protein
MMFVGACVLSLAQAKISLQIIMSLATFVTFIALTLINIKINQESGRKILGYSYLSVIIPGLIASVLWLAKKFGIMEFIQYPGEIISGTFAIYNFEQYFAFSAFLVSGMLVSVCAKRPFTYFCLLIPVFLICFGSENITAIGLSILNIVVYLLYKKCRSFFSIAVKFYLFFAVVFFVSLPLFSYYFIEIFGGFIQDPDSSGFWARVYIHHNFINEFKFLNLINPASEENWFIGAREPHHQFLRLLATGGFFLALSYYLLLVYLIFKARMEDRFVFISCAFVIGGMLEPFGHPYLAVQIIFLLGLSIFLNNSKIVGVN